MMATAPPRTQTPIVAPDPEAVARALAVLRQTPAALVTDIDGTISPIAPTPAEAAVDAVARAALARLATKLALVAVISGRSAGVGSAMVGLPELLYVGNHGMERQRGEALWSHPGAAAAGGALEAALAEITAAVVGTSLAEPTIVENKRLTGTVHYRLAPDPVAARAALLPIVAAAAARFGLVLTEGRLILELRPDVVVNKGTALADLREELGLRGIVFLGDDVTDVDAFVALRKLREDGLSETLRVAVVGAETPAAVRAEGDALADGVAGAAALLAALADVLAGPTGDEGETESVPS